MTLINPNILDTVAQRVYNYLIRRNNISEKIILNEHEVGDYITTSTKWDSTLTGNIVSMSITLSNLTVADCEILAT